MAWAPGRPGYTLDVELQHVPDAFEDERVVWREGWTRCFCCGKHILLLSDRFTVEKRAAFPLFCHQDCALTKHGALLSLEYDSAIQDIMLGRRIWEAVRQLKVRTGAA